ncbi:MAG: Xylulokinase [Microbacteriaceae bacterium]|nr:Xylulokinase [Microbacteriaceae bacterium]
MLVYAVDIGTTNLKVVLYSDGLRRLASASERATYSREGVRVEFDPVELFDTILTLIGRCAHAYGDASDHDAVIVLTGQAESLVLNDAGGRPLRPGLSWLDDRATDEADEIGNAFGADTAFAVTGQPKSSSTWPASKLRWLARHEPRSLAAAASVLMVKDDVIRRFTGSIVGELTTRGFTYFFDVGRSAYWQEMLDFVSVDADTLPEVVPAGLDLGPVLASVAARLPASRSYRVNAGALDHFAAMAGTGSYSAGVISESAGSVLSLSLLARDWEFDPAWKVSFHAGLRPGETVLFNGVDSGGVALDWYRREGLGDMAYGELEERLASRGSRAAPLFLPYLTGVSPPDYLPQARGAFLGLELGHDRIDLAFAVEEGISHVLRRNVDYLAVEPIREIVSTGGGTASSFWNQLKADVCGIDVVVPGEEEATCRGAAVLALVAAGRIDDLADARRLEQPATVRYRPSHGAEREARYGLFEEYLDRLYGDR